MVYLYLRKLIAAIVIFDLLLTGVSQAIPTQDDIMSSTKNETLQTHFVGLPQTPADLISYRNNTCYITPISMAQDPLQPFLEYFMDLNNTRRDSTFPTFVKRTNEKDQTTQIAATFMGEILPKLMDACTVLDVGMGEGDLSAKVASYMNGTCENVYYEGIDQSQSLLKASEKKLITIGIKNYRLIVGDCFGEDIDRLMTHPTLLIASQVLFYAPDIKQFIDKVIEKLGLVALIIGQANNSFLNVMNKKYGLTYKKTDTETTVDGIFKGFSNINSFKVLYSATIEFPIHIDLLKAFSRVLEVPMTSLIAITNPEEREARELLEFIAGAPLEHVEYCGKRDAFLKDVAEHLSNTGGHIQFWNFMSIVVPTPEVKNQLEKQQMFMNCRAFLDANISGNHLMKVEILRQGIWLYYDESNPLDHAQALHVLALARSTCNQVESSFYGIQGRIKRIRARWPCLKTTSSYKI